MASPGFSEVNVEACKRAREMFELIGEQPQRFWEALAMICQEQLPVTSKVLDKHGPLNDQEAQAFERVLMPRGRYAGEAVGDVPVEYILWWTEQDDFTPMLLRYVRSRVFQARQPDVD